MGREDASKTSEIFHVVYAELRKLASSQLARLRPGQTLQPTALVHEAYLKLAGPDDAEWNGRGHFFGAAAQAMREIIVDHVRARVAKKRGGGRAPQQFDSNFDLPREDMPLDDVLAIDRALSTLERDYPRHAQIVVMRYYGGVSMEQIAESLELSTRTVEREWRFARALLAEALAG